MSTVRQPMVVAHRGLHHHYPENSLDAFAAAASAGISWVECDVWPCVRGVPVVIHDDAIDRTTTGSGQVSGHTWEDLLLLGVPPLATVLKALSVLPSRTNVLVEIKPMGPRRFVSSILALLQGYQGWMIQSFYPENISHVWHAFPSALLVEKYEHLSRAVDSDCPNIHAHHSLVDRDLVDRLRSVGRKIGAWTVNDPAEIQRMIDLGIDMLITDEPELAMQMIPKRSP